MISAPENIIRAVAAAPNTQIKSILLMALGYDSLLNPVSSRERAEATDKLHQWFEDKELKQEEVPF